jgi:predicted RNA-binding protein (virulence factor B family)
MISIGRFNTLRIAREAEPGLYLTDGTSEVLLPNRFAPKKEDGVREMRVFVYTDSEDRPVATTQRPFASVGQFAFMECVDSNRIGAFMNWGLDKDLMVPFAEQFAPIRTGSHHVVRVTLDDKTDRLYGSTKLTKFLQPAPEMRIGHEVAVLCYRETDHGMLVIVDEQFGGLVFSEDGARGLSVGDRATGYVKRLREDGKIGVTLVKEGFQAAVAEAPRILQKLSESKGYLPYGDRSSPEEIRIVFGMSKSTFKKSLSQLLKQGKISIEDHGIRLVS